MAVVINRTTLEIRRSVHSPDYPSSVWLHNPDLSAVVDVPQKYWKIVDDSVVEMLQVEKDAVDAMTLDELKEHRIEQIDSKTEELIQRGFEFPPTSGNWFSLTLTAQANLIAFDSARDDPAMTYPAEWNKRDDDGTFLIPDAATAHSFFLTALGTKRAHLDAGTTLKKAIRDAVDTAAVMAVVDNRD